MSLVLLIGTLLLDLPIAQAQSNATNAWGWKEIAVGSTHSLGIKNDGTVWQWGDTTTYRGAEGSETNLNALFPEQVPRLSNIVKVAGGQVHSIALANDGSVWTWGGNHDGQLGDGTKISRTTPQKVAGLTDIVSIEADWTRSFAIKKDGTVWVWGGFYYRAWDGSIQSPVRPAQLAGLEDVIAISAGYGSFMILKSDGTVWYYDDELTQVTGIADIIQIAVGGQYTYGLKKDGTVWYWGANGQGIVNGTSVADNSAPQMLQGIEDVVSIQASAGGPLLLKNDGTVWASGDNPAGQLGIGSYESSDVPVQVHGLKKITHIAAHGIGYRSMAIRADGTLWSWGIGYTGDGTTWNRTTPVGIRSFESQVIDPDPLFVELNGTILQFEQPPILLNNRTLVPLRTIFETLGAKVHWDAATSTITANKGGVSIELVVGSTEARRNEETILLDAPPTIVNGHTLIPIRFVSEALGATVTWDAENKTILIDSLH